MRVAAVIHMIEETSAASPVKYQYMTTRVVLGSRPCTARHDTTDPAQTQPYPTKCKYSGAPAFFTHFAHLRGSALQKDHSDRHAGMPHVDGWNGQRRTRLPANGNLFRNERGWRDGRDGREEGIIHFYQRHRFKHHPFCFSSFSFFLSTYL